MTEDLIELNIAEGVAELRMNRPASSNSFDLPTALAIKHAVGEVEFDPAVSVVLLTGAGKRFCAGGDVASMVAAEDSGTYLKELADVLDGALQRLNNLNKPVVAAVQGAVAGAGIGVMLTADLIVAERGTKFLTAYAGIGLTPDCGVSWLLPRAVGQPRALELALSGRVLEADEALLWGLVTEVIDGSATDRARSISAGLAAGPASAYGQARRLVRASWSRDRAASGVDESATISQAVQDLAAIALIERFAGR